MLRHSPVGLQFMVAMLPTFLIWIFKIFFTLKADAWSQAQLQIWYYWFQIVFVILATAVGQDVKGFTDTLITVPLAKFKFAKALYSDEDAKLLAEPEDQDYYGIG